MAEGHGATVDVDDFVADSELGDRGDTDGGERLVDLEQVEIFHSDTSFFGGLHDGPAGLMK